jgi:hypothetical protein
MKEILPDIGFAPVSFWLGKNGRHSDKIYRWFRNGVLIVPPKVSIPQYGIPPFFKIFRSELRAHLNARPVGHVAEKIQILIQ